ncbi:pancreatic lipase-related protein 2-like isoform X2 [Chelonus insularis]|nr:pancreatic lipase-related protein 2-like isoform X2 [Chelonus insularis]
MNQRRSKGTSLQPKICFEFVGCFADSPQRLSFKRLPEHPKTIQTKFVLYTRANRAKNKEPEMLYYDDNSSSMINSLFNSSKALKVIIHGFKGSGKDIGVVTAANLLLDLEDINVIILDWTRGAGTTYQIAVANTELVGRQLAVVLLGAINLGTKVKDIHVIGFSLGAHVAGCASEVLKTKKLLIGRITGLDPASPFFRRHVLRERSQKLDSSDANLVDVIHTDGAEDFTEGFGLLKPIGHIDFFPNGGVQQPGCNDIKNSIVYSHFHEDILDRSIACSHARAWDLFVESLQSQFGECKFIAWPCTQRDTSFEQGTCFPPENLKFSQEMGYAADGGPLGIFYLPTRAEYPFCGDPLRASVVVAKSVLKTLGWLFIKIQHKNESIVFNILCNLKNRFNKPSMFYNIAAAKFNSITAETTSIEALVWYQPTTREQEEASTQRSRQEVLVIDKLSIEDRKENRWEFCSNNFSINLDGKSVKFEKYVDG